nr:isoamyl acetate hydrolyzing esterase 1 [Hymenolepis microstoma]
MSSEFSWPKCIFFGDSLTQFGYTDEGCYLSILSSKFQRRVDIVGRGFSGYTTRLCLPLMKVLYPNAESLQNTTAFFIFLGANDASFRWQKVDIPEYKSNLRQMVSYLQSLKLEKLKIFLITPPPMDENKKEPDCIALDRPFTRTFENAKKYAEACLEVAMEKAVACVNIFAAIVAQENWKDYLIDGLHFSRKGGMFLAEILSSILEDFLPQKMNFPEWRDALKLDLSKPFPPQ